MSVYEPSLIKRQLRSKAELEALDGAIAEIAAGIEPATVRQVFYQAVVRGLVPKDEARGYKLVQRRLLKLRETGEVSYSWITDNVRIVRGHARYEGPDDFVRVAAEFYRSDYWAESPESVEVWLEKDALAGVLEPVVVDECGLDLHVTRGYASVSYLESAAGFIRRNGCPTHVYLLTDFDPSGLGIAETVTVELIRSSHPTEVYVERLAVDREQIDEYELPTRSTKTTDSRALGFMRQHGTGSVELDAIPPAILRSLVRDSIEQHMNPESAGPEAGRGGREGRAAKHLGRCGMTLHRLVLDFRTGELVECCLYRSPSGPGPGTKGRRREAEEYDRRAAFLEDRGESIR